MIGHVEVEVEPRAALAHELGEQLQRGVELGIAVRVLLHDRGGVAVHERLLEALARARAAVDLAHHLAIIDAEAEPAHGTVGR